MTATWLDISPDDPFGVDNLPYGSWTDAAGERHVVVRLAEQLFSLTTALQGTRFGPLVQAGTLDKLLAAGRATWTAVRCEVVDWLCDTTQRGRVEPHLHPLAGARLALPFAVADLVDFYASEHHATNVGRMFRPEGHPLTPNWKHLPIGYHGRAGTVLVSGAEVIRPSGQSRTPSGEIVFGSSTRLDIEAEIGFVVGQPSDRGSPVGMADFRDHVFGVCLVNDWSARDIQEWESSPLGPFLGKSFATSISAWVTPLDALGEAWTMPPMRAQRPLPYLDDEGVRGALDIDIDIFLNGTRISSPRCRELYWTPAQMMAHLTVNGASLRCGDLYASGTVSGPGRAEFGSLLELCGNGSQTLALDDGTLRTFLEDGDEVVIVGSAPGQNGRIGLGEVRGRVSGGRMDPIA